MLLSNAVRRRLQTRGTRAASIARLALAALVLASAAVPAAGAQEPAPEESAAQQTPTQRAEVVASETSLPPRHREWLRSVTGLISPEERAVFLSLRADYRRDAFIEAFWSIRDPDPRTPVNEMRRRFEELQAAANGFPAGDPRALVYLLNGPPGRWTLPDGRAVARCFARTAELEIWFYGGSERVARRFVVIFQKRARDAPYEIWRFGQSLRPTQRPALPTTDLSQLCADELLRYATAEMSRLGDYDRLLESVTTPPTPPAEWLATLAAGGTELPEGADTFVVEAVVDFPARRQSRTATRVIVRVPPEQAPGREFDGTLFHSFVLTGEILLEEQLFESFRYRFEGPTPEDAEVLPLGFTRYLRSGEFTLRLLLEDVFAERFAQVVRRLEVPSPEGLPEDEPERTLADLTGGGAALELLAPGGGVQVGLVRFTARAGRGFDRVAFFLDDRQVLSKRSPPYSVELDLGETPSPHRVRVVGYEGDREVATDQVWLNQGSQRFRVRLIEPRPGGIYPGAVGARVEVDTPDGQAPDKVELFVDDQLVGTLEKPPYAAGLRLRPDRAAVIRAVAYLADGSSAEDAVVVNTAGYVEQVEVRLVELLIAVVDASGEAILDLRQEEVRVLENGVEQTVRRFLPAVEAPLHLGLLIDRSVSMAGGLRAVTDAAAALARDALRTAEDRVAVLSFADQVTVEQQFSGRPTDAERALASLTAGGRTALYDAVAQALNTFDGVAGARALVLFTDGQDETSRLTLEQAAAAARAAGVVLHVVAPAGSFPRASDRRPLEALASAAGGVARFPEAGDDGVAAAFAALLAELRSRYLVTYQTEPPADAEAPPAITVEVARPGARVRVGGAGG
ncbi:MAG TPA: VWA domain-containing protein [Thermoanaerobaculia bacterium]|nr:VWA domain-containing protein [Thermoanaerobaculia bacterium]